MAHILSEFTNEIYDIHSDAGLLLGDETGGLVKEGQGVSPYALFLGVVVSLLPKVR